LGTNPNNQACEQDWLWYKSPGNLAVAHGRNITFTTCEFAHLGGVGLDAGNGTHGLLVHDSYFWDISGAGLQIGSFDSFAIVDPELQDLDNTVNNSVLTLCAVEFRGAVAINVGYTARTTIINNDLGNLTYSGMSMGWGWSRHPITYAANNTVAYNRVSPARGKAWLIRGIERTTKGTEGRCCPRKMAARVADGSPAGARLQACPQRRRRHLPARATKRNSNPRQLRLQSRHRQLGRPLPRRRQRLRSTKRHTWRCLCAIRNCNRHIRRAALGPLWQVWYHNVVTGIGSSEWLHLWTGSIHNITVQNNFADTSTYENHGRVAVEHTASPSACVAGANRRVVQAPTAP
jgi:hypothetical protein